MLYHTSLKFYTLLFLLATLSLSTVHAQEQKSYSISKNGSLYAHIQPSLAILLSLYLSFSFAYSFWKKRECQTHCPR